MAQAAVLGAMSVSYREILKRVNVVSTVVSTFDSLGYVVSETCRTAECRKMRGWEVKIEFIRDFAVFEPYSNH
jgi:hypothetical protein